MRIIKTLGFLISPMLALLGIDFALNKVVKLGKMKFSRESKKKYEEIESEYKEELIKWAKKRGINIKRPSIREQKLLKKEINVLEGELIDKFSDWLRKTRKTRDLKILLAGIEAAKMFNDHIKGRF